MGSRRAGFQKQSRAEPDEADGLLRESVDGFQIPSGAAGVEQSSIRADSQAQVIAKEVLIARRRKRNRSFDRLAGGVDYQDGRVGIGG